MKPVFFVESDEEITLCPNCGSILEYHCRVVRGLTVSTGLKNTYSIRILKCINTACPTSYHRELPDIITPYRRYDTESIEEAIIQENKKITVAAEHSTIYRWRKWFRQNVTYIIMALLSVAAVLGDSTESSSLTNQTDTSITQIETIKGIVARKTKWLNEAVRILVNSSKWIFNRSAFLSG